MPINLDDDVAAFMLRKNVKGEEVRALLQEFGEEVLADCKNRVASALDDRVYFFEFAHGKARDEQAQRLAGLLTNKQRIAALELAMAALDGLQMVAGQ